MLGDAECILKMLSYESNVIHQSLFRSLGSLVAYTFPLFQCGSTTYTATATRNRASRAVLKPVAASSRTEYRSSGDVYWRMSSGIRFQSSV